MKEQFIELGYISGFYGVRGWVKVYSNTEPKENILKYSHWMVKLPEQGWTQIDVLDGRLQGKGVVAKLAGFNDKDQTLHLIKAKIAIEESQLPDCKEGEYYWRDLIGCTVTNLDAIEIGILKGLLETGAHDVMEIKTSTGKIILIPWVKEVYIQKVDLEAKNIIVDWVLDTQED